MSKTVFLSYASEDSDSASRIAAALREGGIEVWFDKNQLRGGDAWDTKIREQVKDCSLFIPIISARTQARDEGYFRLEWKLAVDRSYLMAPDKTYLLPVAIDDTPQSDRRIPERFRELQWTVMPDGHVPEHFVGRVQRLLVPAASDPQIRGPASTEGALTNRESGLRFEVRGKRSMQAAISAIVLLMLALYSAYRLRHPEPRDVPLRATKSIAVLPFVDLSEKHDQGYLADGMAAEVLNVLSEIPGLHVVSRTSSFRFKDEKEDLRKIGSVLGVVHIVEGSLQRSGSRVRVNARVDSSADGSHEWSETYESDMADILSMQKDIATRIARALQIVVDAASISGGVRPNPEAYDLFLRGLNNFDRYDQVGIREAIGDFESALQLDPSLTRADEALAMAEFVYADDDFISSQVGFERARESAKRLLHRDPRSSEAYALLSRIEADYDWDWEGAKREAELAIAINPRDEIGLYGAGVVETFLGHWDIAERQLRSALTLDPLSADLHYALGNVLNGAGRYSEAVTEFKRVTEISPSYAWGHAVAALTLDEMGQSQDAIKEAERESMAEVKLWALAVIDFHAGNRADSDAALARLMHEAPDRMAYAIATAQAARGEREQAFDWLERAYRQRDNSLPYIKSETLLAELRQDPRYADLLRRMKLPI